MKLNYVWLWFTSMLLGLKCSHEARPNDCMPRSNFMSRGDLNGWRLIGFVFHYYKKISLGDCAEECLRRTNCKSLNYNAYTMYCELNTESKATMPANVSSDPEFYHSLRRTWETDNLLLGFTLPTCAVNQKVSATDNRSCLLAECNDPPKRQFAQYTSTLREVDSVVQYSCLPQYGSLGDVTGTCNPDGSWKNNSSECWRNCTHPPVVNNGTVKRLWALETQSLTYVCDATYEAAGDTRVYCQANGSWTETNFLCLRICENPPLVENSSPNASQTLDGRAVSYACHVNYVGFGNPEVLCKPDGTWKNSSYVCIRECKNPPTVPNSTPSETKVLHGNSTSYTCNMNYVMWPPDTNMEASCESDGRWTLLANFSCKRECNNPPWLDSGTANESSALEGSSVTYMCDNGYDYVDAIRSTCNADGNWTAPSSSCLRVCENPRSVQNSIPNATRTVNGRGVSYTCHNNYVGFGNKEILCKPDGTWSNTAYVCIRECKNPPTVPNSTPSETKVLHGNSTSYTCNMNYVVWPPDTNMEASCESDGRWTFLANFSCKRECTGPPSLAFGTANESSALEGSSVTYMCDPGYNSVAAIKSTCTAIGNWTAPSSSCLRECTGPPSLALGTANASSALEGSSVTYMCNPGYNSVAAITSTCTAIRKWTAPNSSCVRECQKPPLVQFAVANTTKLLAGNKTFYTCNPNYVVQPNGANTEVQCQSDGNWTLLGSFACIRECQKPPLVQFAVANTTKLLAGNKTFYTCNPNYVVQPNGANTEVQCQSDGNWTLLGSFACIRECTGPPSLAFGTANESSALQGSSVTYMCDTGYKSVAAIKSTCTAIGNWTNPSSSCLRECNNPPSLGFGTANESSALEGSSVTYMCHTGYDSVAAINSTCSADGNWTTPGSSCLRECTNPPSLAFGIANESSALEGSSVIYTCYSGYDSVAAINSTCNADGNWTEPSSSCLKECTDPPSPLGNATTTATSALAGQIIVYTCNDGLSPVNATELVCLEDGSWSEANFLCE